MKKLTTFSTFSIIVIALIGSLATRAIQKINPYFYYNTVTHAFVQVDEDSSCAANGTTQCYYENTNYPLYATASFVSPLKHF